MRISGEFISVAVMIWIFSKRMSEMMEPGIFCMIPKYITVFHVEVFIITESHDFLDGSFKWEGVDLQGFMHHSLFLRVLHSTRRGTRRCLSIHRENFRWL
jgi:hypothetical protein